MILAYIILQGFLEGVQWSDFIQVADTSRLRGPSLKLKILRKRLDLLKFTFAEEPPTNLPPY